MTFATDSGLYGATGVADLTTEIAQQLPGLPRPTLAAYVRQAVSELNGSVPPSALPELTLRLVRQRVTAQLVGDADVAEAVLAVRSIGTLGELLATHVRRCLACDGAAFRIRGRSLPGEDPLAGWAMRDNLPVVVDDIDVAPGVPAAVYRALAVRGVVAVPVPADEHRAAAALVAHWAQPGRASAADLPCLGRLAIAAAATLASLRASEDPPDSRQRTRVCAG